MTFTEQKAFEEIVKMLTRYEKVCVIGCSECATLCLTGGEPQVAEMKEKLEEAGKTVTGAFVPEGALCNTLALKGALKDQLQLIEEADCLLTFGCGNGAHAVGRVTGKLAVSGNDTCGISVKAPGMRFLERCSSCGKCELGWTGGLCPTTMCSKGLLNGPCGGVEGGKCEVDKERDCGWVLIHKRLEELGQTDQLDEVRFRDYSTQATPRDFQLVNRGVKK